MNRSTRTIWLLAVVALAMTPLTIRSSAKQGLSYDPSALFKTHVLHRQAILNPGGATPVQAAAVGVTTFSGSPPHCWPSRCADDDHSGGRGTYCGGIQTDPRTSWP